MAGHYELRRSIYERIEADRGSKVVAYVTGDRRNMEAQVHSEVLDIFVEHLDALFPTKRISLLLYTRGGDPLAAWSLVNLLRMFCDELEVIVPVKAHSAGTILSLGADRIVMTKQATLSPIDPSLHHPLGPQIPGAGDARAPVSVEAVQGYLELVKAEGKLSDSEAMTQIMVDLSGKVHPLVLGQMFRTRSQIKNLARQLLAHQVKDAKKQKKIIDFLCSDSGSHDYTINRREGAALGLNIEKCSAKLYQLLTEFTVTVRDELCLAEPWSPRQAAQVGQSVQYSCTRCLVETMQGGSHVYVSEGELQRVRVPQQSGIVQDAVSDTRNFEGWRQRCESKTATGSASTATAPHAQAAS